MKSIRLLIFLFLGLGLSFSCEKGNTYYTDFSKDNISFDGTIYEYLVNKPGQYDSLILLLEILPELKDKLSNPNDTLSFFVTDNRSFALAIKNLNTKLKEAKKDPLYLEDLDKKIMDTLAYRYLIEDLIGINDLKEHKDGIKIISAKYDYEMHGQYRVLTASGLVGKGDQQIVYSDVNNSIYRRYWQNANTRSVNLKAKNGYIHTLTPQHEFAFGKLIEYFTKDK